MPNKTMMRRLLAPRRLLALLAICLVAGWASYDYVLDRLVIYSIKSDSPVLLRQVLDLGASPNAKDRKGHTALNRAVLNLRYEIIETLLDNGVDPNQVDQYGHLLIDDALCFSDERVVQLLLEHGVDPNQILIRQSPYNGETLLNTAASLDNPRKVQVLLSHGADPLKVDLNGHNAFYYAQDPEVLRLLIAAIGREPDPSWLNPNPNADDI